jgi:hypothetical protein
VEEAGEAGQRELIERYLFDRCGRVLESRNRVSGDSPGQWEHQVFRYIYQPQGRDYEIDLFFIDPAKGEKPIDLQRHFVKFDSLGRCVEENTVDEDGESYGKDVYEYDGRGDLATKITYDPDGTVSSREERTYSLDHKLLSERSVQDSTQGSEHPWLREYRYDERGNQTDVFLYEEGVMTRHQIYRYDEHNRLISWQTVVTDPQKDPNAVGCLHCGLAGETKYKYDANGRLIEERTFQPGNKPVDVQKYSYDPRGNRLEWPDCKYEYDSHGNWVKAVGQKGTSDWVRYRVIEYY